jgi:hypothetical protein
MLKARMVALTGCFEGWKMISEWKNLLPNRAKICANLDPVNVCTALLLHNYKRKARSSWRTKTNLDGEGADDSQRSWK